MYQCRFICYNKCTTLVRDVDNREAVCVGGGGVYGKSLHLLLNFVMSLKLL